MGELQVQSVGLSGGMPIIESDDPIPGLEVESVYIPGPRGLQYGGQYRGTWDMSSGTSGPAVDDAYRATISASGDTYAIAPLTPAETVISATSTLPYGGGWCAVNNEYDLVSGTRYYTMFGFVQENVSAADITAPPTNNPCLSVLIVTATDNSYGAFIYAGDPNDGYTTTITDNQPHPTGGVAEFQCTLDGSDYVISCRFGGVASEVLRYPSAGIGAMKPIVARYYFGASTLPITGMTTGFVNATLPDGALDNDWYEVSAGGYFHGKWTRTGQYVKLISGKTNLIIVDDPTVLVRSVNGIEPVDGDVTVAKSDIGLGNVDNTSDANKPISTATQTALNLKLDASAYNDRYKGTYPSLAALQAAHPTSSTGDYAIVDPGAGTAALSYIWDVQDGWVRGSDTAPTTTDALVEGSSNLYFTAARVRDADLTGLSTATNAAITATDSVLSAFGKLQAQVSARFLKAGDTLTGTGGNGFFGAIKQSSKPSTPADGFRLYADASGRLSWIGENGFVRVFDGTGNTADRTYTLPDADVTFMRFKGSVAWTSLPAAASGNNGDVYFVTDVGTNGSYWQSNGSNWFPTSPVTLYTSTDSYARAPSGTINTGSSGNITFGTAANRAYTEGLYVYLPSIATTPAITAGFYWCVMSSTTTGTLYASKGGAAINFTVGASYTGVTTAIDVPQQPLKGGVMGSYRRINITGSVSATNNANAKTTAFRFGGTSFGNNGITNNQAYQINCNIQNKGASLQILSQSVLGLTGGLLATIAINTASDTTYGPALLTGTTATDWWIVDCWQAVLFPH